MAGHRLWCRLLPVVAGLLLAGASSGLFGQLLYVGNVGDATISSYVIDQDSGLLTELLPRVTSTGIPSSIAIHPNGKFVYITNGGNVNLGVNGPSIAVFSINPDTGALTLASSVALTPGTGPQGATIDAAGAFLFFANSGTSNVSVYAIDPSTGALSPVPGSPFAGLPANNKVVVHPSGKFAYVSTGNTAPAGQIAVFNIGADGALTPITGSPFAARNVLFWMTMDTAGKFLFVAERQDNAVLTYSVDASTGVLTLVGQYPAAPGVSGLAVDPGGKFLYASAFGPGSVLVYSIGATGALAPVRNTGAILGAFDAILDPSGKFLYIPGQQANAVAGFAIDSVNGTPTPLPQQFFPAGVQPTRGATVLLSPPVIPPIRSESVTNYFSHAIPGTPNAGIAQGARIAISGKNIGPAVGVNSDFPLQTQLAGASIQIESGDVTTAALMVFASNGLVTGVVPSTTPLGDATVTVTYNGRTTAALPITIVPVSPGIRTRNDQGSGPARALNADPDTVLTLDTVVNNSFPNNTLSSSAKPGQNVGLSAMGLGAANFDETQLLSQQMDTPIDVIVGNKLATVRGKLRAGSGNDYILIKLPDDAPEGCYVPVAIRAGGVTSNVASISISSSGGSCSDAAGLAAADIDQARKSGQLNMGWIELVNFDFGPGGLDNEAQGQFGRYDFASLQAALAPGAPQVGVRSVGAPPLGSCVVTSGTPTRQNNPFHVDGDPIRPLFLNVGQALNVNAPAGKAQLPAPDYSFQSGEKLLTPGDYSVDNGAGNQAVGAFKAVLNLPSPVAWTNKDSVSSIDRTKDLTVTWSGGAQDKEFATIFGVSANQQAAMAFLCTEKVSAGKFTVPSWVLSSLPKSDVFQGGGSSIPGGLFGVGTVSFATQGRFTAPGLDFAVFTYEQAAVNLLLFQ